MIIKPFAAYFLARHLQSTAKLCAMVHGKKVAVVGNASSLLKQQQGALINAHDIIIRFNAGIIKDSDSQGSRTDILGLSTPFDHQQVKQMFDPSLVYWLTPKWSKMPVWPPQFRNSVEVFPKHHWQELYRLLQNHRPTSGAMMVFLLANYTAASSIRLYGFDFFKTPTNYQNKLPVGKAHSFEIEKEYVRQLCLDNPKVSIFDITD